MAHLLGSTVVRIDNKLTDVGVRTGSVGLWDQKVSRQIQDIIGESLNAKSAAARSKLSENRASIKLLLSFPKMIQWQMNTMILLYFFIRIQTISQMIKLKNWIELLNI